MVGSKPRNANDPAPNQTAEAMAERIGAATPSATKTKSLPPVHLWDPPFAGNIPMVIKRDGSWHYMGSPIHRKPMVRLFSTVLRRDGDDYFLVTPVEKVGITVEDAPFLAVEMHVEAAGRDQTLTFRTQVEDVVVADKDHPLRMEFRGETSEPAPYIHVRAGLEALIARPVYYDLVDLGEEAEVDGVVQFGVWSGGTFFPFAPAHQVNV